MTQPLRALHASDNDDGEPLCCAQRSVSPRPRPAPVLRPTSRKRRRSARKPKSEEFRAEPIPAFRDLPTQRLAHRMQSMTTCPDGHVLKIHQKPVSSIQIMCDKCGESCGNESHQAYCSECNIDFCVQCFSRIAQKPRQPSVKDSVVKPRQPSVHDSVVVIESPRPKRPAAAAAATHRRAASSPPSTMAFTCTQTTCTGIPVPLIARDQMLVIECSLCHRVKVRSKCPNCTHALVVRQNKTSGDLFLGCSQFSASSCRFTGDIRFCHTLLSRAAGRIPPPDESYRRR